jgi:hypothetical protein
MWTLILLLIITVKQVQAVTSLQVSSNFSKNFLPTSKIVLKLSSFPNTYKLNSHVDEANGNEKGREKK